MFNRLSLPPVFHTQADVDDIHEYLLLKGVAATSVHGGRAQEEREQVRAARFMSSFFF